MKAPLLRPLVPEPADASIDDFDKALALDSFRSVFFFVRARTFLDCRKPDKAADDCRKALIISPDLAEATEPLKSIGSSSRSF
ncbi:MAG: hypothetical protein JXA71_00615 [Chitinispirillaceae bacterium]|nr:hypothetical protein [Chitinispirillaceae bacterium]